MPTNGSAGGSGDGELSFGGNSGIPFAGSSNGTAATANSSTAGPGRNAPDVSAKGCGCRVGGDTDAASTKLAWLSALLGLGLVLQRRRSARN
jgi:MYXO-CTERM domain-containing protein